MNIKNSIEKMKFNRILKKSLKINFCPKCNKGSTSITIDLPIFGCTQARIKCKYCGYEVYHSALSGFYSAGNRIATPITAYTLSRGIFNVAKKWNDN